MNDLSVALNRLKKILLTTYVIALITSISIFLALNFVHHKTLAESFALSARTSLIINDLRQAMFTLNTALPNNFEAIDFQAQDGTLVFSLPAERPATFEPFMFKFVSPVLVNPAKPSAGIIGTLVFFHNSGWAVGLALLAWASLLLFAIPFSRWARRLIETRHREMLTLSNAETTAALARQVAHDIRSPVSALRIVGTIKGLADEPRELLISAANRINKIAEDLLETTRPEPRVTQTPSTLIEQIVKEKQATLPSNVQIHKGDFPNLPVVIAPTALGRIVSNLINNAIESIDGPGSVTIEGVANVQSVILTIGDTGKGISADHLAQIGRPGFTFGKKRGSGLGLFHAVEALQAVGGDLKVHSKEGFGTTIVMTLMIDR